MKLAALTFAAAIAFAGGAHAVTVTDFVEKDGADVGHRIADAYDLGTLSNAGDDIRVRGGTIQAEGDNRDVYSFSSATDFNVFITSFKLTAGVTNWSLFKDDGSFKKADDLVSSKGVRDGATGDLFGTISAGDYFLWVFESSIGQAADYDFDIVAASGPSLQLVAVNPVPVPAGLPLLAVGIGAFAWMRRRKGS